MSEQDAKLLVDDIIASTLQRRESGHPVSDDEVMAAHPDLAHLLSEKLKQLALLATARRLAESNSCADTISIGQDGSTQSGQRVQADSVYPGQRIRHYVLEERIGEGGFGSVWRARDSKLECDVAVKIPRRELSPDDTDRFIDEARVSAQLRKHPNIVSVHEADWDADTAFIVSDYIDGQSLDARLDESRIPFSDSAELLITICNALHHAHDEGIIHRDLKPDNILLDHSGVPHITDFGLAMRESKIDASVSGRITGTAAYMSPEQARGDSDSADCRSDIFSLGIVFFELLTGERPYRGSLQHILRQITSTDPPRPRSFDPRVPMDLETICLKCLEPDPTRRYQSATELSEDLQRYRRHEPIQARPASTAGRLLRWSKRNPSIPLLTLSLLIVTILSTWAAFRLLDGEVDALQSAYTGQAEENLKLLADYAADDAKLNLALRFDQVRSMAVGLANNERAMQKLAEWNVEIDGEERDKILAQILESLGERTPIELVEIQQALEDLVNAAGPDIRERTYSLFLCDAKGNQVARHKKRDTLGTQFAYRSYFTGDAADATEYDPAELMWEKGISEPKLSDSFLTVDQEAWVIAVSTPIWDADEFQGVTGVFIELGDLISDPESRTPEGNARSMLVLDAREGRNRARRIHDTGANESLSSQSREDVRVDLDNLDESFLDHRMEIRSVALSDVAESGLFVLMVEPFETIQAPGNQLRDNLVIIGLSVVGFAAFGLTVTWLIILQRIVKT